MKKIIRFLLKQRTSVKPVDPFAVNSPWLVRQSSTAGEFVDDLKRYGLGVALYNLRAQWRLDR